MVWRDPCNMVGQVTWFIVAVVLGGAASLTPEQETARHVIGEANNAFSIDLYQAVKSQPGNLIVSPLSAGAVLALVLQGAGGSTAQQLLQALRLPADPAQVREGYGALFDSLQANDEVIVRIANKLYAAKDSHIKPPFRQAAVQSFRADAEELDFARQNAEAVRAINQWVEQITDNKIKDLLQELDPSTLMVLVNAIYFKGTWANTFEETATRNEVFHTSSNSQVNVPMMHNTASFSHGRIPELNARIIELPYKGYKMKMMVILPDEIEGLAAVEAGLSQINFTQISRQMTHGEVILSLPKFKIESKFELEKTLPNLGIRDLFSPGACNLTGITDASVVVSKVIQKAFVEVTEKGTVAAAATGAQVTLLSAAPPQQPVIFKVDHPFLFFIMDALLAAGSSWNPNPPPPEIFTVDRPFLFLLSYEDLLVFVGRVRSPAQ